MPPPGLKLLLALVAAFVTAALVQSPNHVDVQGSSTTREHLTRELWWPTKQFPDQSKFAGRKACASCHAELVRTQSTTQMAQTLMPASDSAVLAGHTGEIFTFGSYRYSVERAAGSFTLKVTDGTQKGREPLQWAFGSGAVAQSYVWWQNGQLYESRFNYFAPLHGFDRTPARLQGGPISLEMAEGRQMAEFDARKCYACHSTALTDNGPLAAAQFHPGITCESCHGPGREHIAAIRTADSDEVHIVNPAKLTPVQSVDFCGACHGTPRDIELMGTAGKITVRFPAYRLEKSRCWGSNGDARLTCYACHNPHRPLEREDAAYDVACLRCHANSATASEHAAAKQPACPVAKSRCTSCHMARVNIADMHYNFTDHNIRIVKRDAPFPD